MSDSSTSSGLNPAQKVVNYLFLWKVALAKLAIQCAITGITYYMGAMANTHFADLDVDSRVKLFLGMGVGILTLLWAFLGKVEKSLESGDYNPPDDGNTTIIQRKTTQTDTIQTSTPPAPALSQSNGPPPPPSTPGGASQS